MKSTPKKSPVNKFAIGLLSVCLLGLPTAGRANNPPALTGTATVQDSGTIYLNGQKIHLWGVNALASDQQCWQGDQAWCCGEQATMALRHFVQGRTIECIFEHESPDDLAPVSKCYRWKGQHKIDLSLFLILNGLAMEDGVTSGGFYFDAENSAQTQKRGIWSGRFQTARDWRDGVQRFIGKEGDEDKNDSENQSYPKDQDE